MADYNTATLKRFMQGFIIGAAIAAIVFNYVYWEVITGHHTDTEHTQED